MEGINFSRKIKPGFYLDIEGNELYGNVVFVSMKENTMSFTPLSFRSTYFGVKLRYSRNRPETRESLSTVKEFMSEFLNFHEFYNENELQICYHRSLGYFIIDYKDEKILWTDKRVYPLKKRNRLPFRSKRVILSFGKAIKMKIYSRSLQEGSDKLALLSRETLKPKNLKSFFLDEKDGKPNSCKSPFEFEIELVGDEYALLRMTGLYERAGSWIECDMFEGPDFEDFE